MGPGIIRPMNENWDLARRRFAAFWAREIIDRPCLQFVAPPQPGGGATHLAEAFPIKYIQQGGLAAMMGCAQEPGEGTVWTRPCRDNLDGLAVRVDRRSPVLAEMIRAIRAAAEQSPGRYVTSLPANMGNPGDTLALICGYENLCVQLQQDEERVRELEEQILRCWRELYDLFYDLTQPYRPGSCTQWLPVYHDGRCTLVEADFISMISPAHLERVYLPAIRGRVEHVERSLFHLDGPDAARHLDALLDVPGLDGIQWEPGAKFAADRRRWLPLLQKIQSRGKCLWVACHVGEAEQMLDQLSPYGLILSVLGCPSVDTARSIEKMAERCAARHAHTRHAPP